MTFFIIHNSAANMQIHIGYVVLKWYMTLNGF